MQKRYIIIIIIIFIINKVINGVVVFSPRKKEASTIFLLILFNRKVQLDQAGEQNGNTTWPTAFTSSFLFIYTYFVSQYIYCIPETWFYKIKTTNVLQNPSKATPLLTFSTGAVTELVV